MFNSSEGKLEKLKIIPCEKPDFSGEKTSEAYEVLLNPEKYSEKYEVQYDTTQTDGSTGADLRFKKIKSQQLDLNFIFDGTGVLLKSTSFGTNLLTSSTVESVPDQIERFKKVAFDLEGTIHQPRYLKLVWGEQKKLFKGRLTNLNITYTLFKPDGTPLRATADATFKESIDKPQDNAKKANSSPDLTHVRIVKAGDTLPLMTYKIYGDPKYHLEVARINGITNIRKLIVGSKIVFPPLDKTSA